MSTPFAAVHGMLRDFPRLGPRATLREVLRALAEVDEESAGLAAVALEDERGRYLGLFTARSLLRRFLERETGGVEWRVVPSDGELLVRMAEFGALPAQEFVPTVPVLAPNEALLGLVAKFTSDDHEVLPVVEDEVLLGVLPVTAVFSAVASLALTPEHEGIRRDAERAADAEERRRAETRGRGAGPRKD